MFFFNFEHKVFSFDEFPEDKNKFLVLNSCIACHSHRLISQQAMTKDQWNKTLNWMEKKHNLVIEGDKVRQTILNYLVKYFGPKREKEISPMGERPINPLPLE